MDVKDGSRCGSGALRAVGRGEQALAAVCRASAVQGYCRSITAYTSHG